MPRPRAVVRSATHLKMQRIVRLQMMGKTPEEIAEGFGCTSGDINDLIKHPEYVEIRDAYVEKIYGPVDEMLKAKTAGTLLEEAAPDAAEALINLMYNDDTVVRERAIRGVLDRAGFGPVQRKAVRARVELDPVSAQLLSDAMKESRIEDAEFTDATPVRPDESEQRSLPPAGKHLEGPQDGDAHGSREGGDAATPGGAGEGDRGRRSDGSGDDRAVAEAN